ncbi:hypothetical protein ACF090_43625 [Streptomyces sp. NPDC014892]|uniref:hypothetical protein n=1 Tax=Streptomyces sp. NPDC014892 TaxID=3364930 RepID=UPI0036FFF18D
MSEAVLLAALVVYWVDGAESGAPLLVLSVAEGLAALGLAVQIVLYSGLVGEEAAGGQSSPWSRA